MARIPFIGGNWKCNGTMAFLKDMIDGTLNKVAYDHSKVDVMIAPTSIHLGAAKGLLASHMILSAQNMSATGNGAFTGEVTADQLVDMGIKWTILGHSERRSLFDESSEVVARKTKYALEKGLNVVLCIGEQLKEREAGTTNQVLKEQLDACKGSIADWGKVVVAYEPVWAIGTGKVASPAQAQETQAYVRKWLKENVSAEVSASTRIIYGGSVSDANCGELIQQEDVDGFLIGGAALKPAFATIIKTVASYNPPKQAPTPAAPASAPVTKAPCCQSKL